jgi:Swiss Army Knife RNA repair-like protein
MNNNRLIFLDFDGVINRVGMTGYLIGADRDALEPRLVRRVGALANTVDASVVLSTAWRNVHSVEHLTRLLAARGFPADRIIGVTPHSDVRGREIAAYLDAHRGARFVVLDDNDRGHFNMDAVRRWLVKTNPAMGVTTANIARAATLLEEGPRWLPTRPTTLVPPAQLALPAAQIN